MNTRPGSVAPTGNHVRSWTIFGVSDIVFVTEPRLRT